MGSRVSTIALSAALGAATAIAVYPRLFSETPAGAQTPRTPITDLMVTKALSLAGMSPEGIKNTQF